MTMEAFLINPYRKKRKSARRANPLSGGLLSRMMKKYGRKRGMKEAWKQYRGSSSTTTTRRRKLSRNSWSGNTAAHRSASLKGWRKRRSSVSMKKYKARRSLKLNPFGEEVIVVGANPRKKRSRRRKSGGVMVKYRDNRVRRHRVGARRRKLYDNPRRRRSTSVVRYRDNRVRRYHRRNPVRSHRRYRRNPAAVATMGGISLSRPTTLLIPIAVGLGARFATARVPVMLGIVNPLPKYGVQAAVAVGGGLLLNKFVGKTNAMVWTVVSLVTIAEDLLNQYVFSQSVVLTSAPVAGAAGLGYQVEDAGAFPGEGGMGAYPYEGGGY